MQSAYDEIAKLSHEERALLEKMMQEEGVDTSRLPMSKRTIDKNIPLSYSQERLFSLWSLAPDNPSENVYNTFELKGNIEIKFLEKAINEVISTNEIMRTFCKIDGTNVYQEIQPELKISLQEIDFTSFNDAERTSEVKNFIEREISIPFDLTKLPIYRALLIKLDLNHYILLLITHQFVTDGFSAGLILQSISEFYNQLIQKNEIKTQLNELDYADFTLWQKKRIEGEAGKVQIDFWKNELRDLPIQIPFQKNQLVDNNAAHNALTYSFSFGKELSEKLKTFSSSEGFSIYMIVAAALELTLYRMTGQIKIVITTSVSTRGAAETQNMVGNFSNNLMLKNEFSNDKTLKEILISTRENVGSAFTYQEMPIEYLITQLQKSGEEISIPKIQVLYMLRDKKMEEIFQLNDIKVKKLPVDFNHSKLDLYLDVISAGDDLSASLTYKKSTFDDSTINEFINIFKKIAEKIVSNVNSKISTLPKFEQLKSSKNKSVKAKDLTFIAPSSETQVKLAEIWQKYFKLEKISITDNFFDLGGHSLLALSLFNDIEKTFSKKLPLATLFKSQTIEQISNIIDDKEQKVSWSSIVPIQPKGNKIPFFCIHGAGGNVLLYKELAQYLGDDQPFYGIQSKGLDGTGNYHKTIEEMATHYIEEVVKTYPSGPYIIGGYCMGGTIALEMAQKLTKMNKNVPLIVFLDTYNFALQNDKISATSKIWYGLQNAFFHLKNLSRISLADKKLFIKEKYETARERLALKFTRVRNKSIPLQKVNDDAALKYNPKSYKGNVVIFKPEVMFSQFDEANLGWGDLLKNNLKIIDLPLYPKGMLVEPFVKTLAEKLKIELDNLQTKAS